MKKDSTAMRFAIIDVETTGKGLYGNCITEICIVILEAGEVVDKFTSLVNPERFIPPFITGLTGIDNELVKDAPKFHEIVDEIDTLTRNAIFVAHNVNFDYNVIRGEFKNLGRDFIRKKLCTVRLSRKLIPGLYSYSLGKLCSSLKIPLNDRHRAEGDTDATVLVFQKILSLDPDGTIVGSFLNVKSKEATLPPHLKKENIDELPAQTGIYLFRDKQGKIIYAGKALNIKKRVISHFYDKKTKEYLLGQETHSIDHEVTGNELIALLLEADKINKHYPKYNKAQKITLNPFCIVQYKNQRGVLQLAIMRTKKSQLAVDYFFTRAAAVERLEELCVEYELCPRFCGIQESTDRCSHYKITTCKGICMQEEGVDEYNLRVRRAIAQQQSYRQDFAIKLRGRHADEHSFVLVRGGTYRGYGFIDQAIQIMDTDALEDHLVPQKNTYHTERIIKSYLKREGDCDILKLQPSEEQVHTYKMMG